MSKIGPKVDRVPTGVPGLDDILFGGLPARRLYLVHGSAGVGKTTLGMQFLLEGARRGEKVLYITLSETEEEIRDVATGHGWNLDGVALFEMGAVEQILRLDDQDSVFHPADVQLPEATRSIIAMVDKVNPSRVVFDSISELRLMSMGGLSFRRQILGLKQHFAGRSCTSLILDDREDQSPDVQLATLVHGIFDLEQLPQEYGADRRRLRVRKVRGLQYRGGYHDYKIVSGGLVVFPRLVAAEHRQVAKPDVPASGVRELDALIGGGLDRGTSTLVLGPAGTGKSALAVQYAVAAAQRGEHPAIFLFDEGFNTLFTRSQALGMPLHSLIESGQIVVRQIDPAEMPPGELIHRIRELVEAGSRMIVIDSLTGFMSSMPEEKFLLTQMHELLMYLNQQGVTTILVMAQHGLVGSTQTPVDVSYLADSVVLMRFFEDSGQVRRAISVVKRRSGYHEGTIREFKLGSQGVSVGPALSQLQGVMTGVPTFIGGRGESGGGQP